MGQCQPPSPGNNGIIRQPATRYGFTEPPKHANNKCRLIPLPLKSGAVTFTPKLEHPEPTSSPTPDGVGSINSLYSELGQGYITMSAFLKMPSRIRKTPAQLRKYCSIGVHTMRPLLQAIYFNFHSSTSSRLHGPEFESAVAIGLKPLLLIDTSS